MYHQILSKSCRSGRLVKAGYSRRAVSAYNGNSGQSDKSESKNDRDKTKSKSKFYGSAAAGATLLCYTPFFVKKSKEVQEKEKDKELSGHEIPYSELPSPHPNEERPKTVMVKLLTKFFSPLSLLISEFTDPKQFENGEDSENTKQPLWMTAKDAENPINKENPQILKLLKIAKVMSNRYVNLGPDHELCHFMHERIEPKKIEEILFEAHKLAVEPETLEKYPTIYINVLSCLAEFNLEIKRDYKAAKFLYQKLNQQILGVMKYPMNNNASLETSFKVAQCYLRMGEFENFAKILNWVEMTLNRNIRDMQGVGTGSAPDGQTNPNINNLDLFKKEITKEIIAQPNKINYFTASEVVKYYLDSLTLRAMIMELWTSYYYDRGIKPNDAVKFSKQSTKYLKEIYHENDGRIILANANYSLCLLQNGSFESSIKESLEVEKQMANFSYQVIQNPPDFAQEHLCEKWATSIKNNEEFSSTKPYDDLNLRNATMVWVILGRVNLDYYEHLVKSNKNDKSIDLFRNKGKKYLSHAKYLAEMVGDKDLRYYVEMEVSGKAKKMAAISG